MLLSITHTTTYHYVPQVNTAQHMAHNGVIADHINRLIRNIHGPQDRGPVRQRVNELLAVFDPPG